MAQVSKSVAATLTEHLDATLKVLKDIDVGAVGRLIERLRTAYAAGQRVFVFGNGGSAASASHFAEDLAKGTLGDMSETKRLRAQSLTDPMPLLTALGNDCGYDVVFREQLITWASPGDVAIAISGSGNSPNVLRAIEWARENGLFTCGMTGFGGGKLASLVDLEIRVPIDDMEVAENGHIVVMHMVVSGLRRAIQEGC
jgi:D-sedoheptulose 7-phosphate isomerase